MGSAQVRRIGLSLGADLCWPRCYEAILQRLNPQVTWEGKPIRFEVERVTTEPFALNAPCPYDVVIDRLTHWYLPRREWIKKAILMDDLYVFNNPWTIQSMEKHTTYCAMAKLGLPIPPTVLVPPKSYAPVADLQVTLERYARLFDLSAVGEQVGYPLYMKPYDGGAWRGVSRIENTEQLHQAYDASGTSLMHLQQGLDGYDLFVRCIGMGPQFHIINYNPAAPLHDRYMLSQDFLSPAESQALRDMTLTINSFFGWDFNSCEAIRKDGKWYLIDFANACPDSQVTSLHFHFPWLVTAYLKWSLYAATTRRKFRKSWDWDPYYAAAAAESTDAARLARYAEIGHERFESADFASFCATQLADLDRVAKEFFHSDEAREAIAEKVAALYPAHEVTEFTDLFWDRVKAYYRQSST